MARKFKVKITEICKIICQFCQTQKGKTFLKIDGKIPKMAKTDDENGKSGPTKM